MSNQSAPSSVCPQGVRNFTTVTIATSFPHPYTYDSSSVITLFRKPFPQSSMPCETSRYLCTVTGNFGTNFDNTPKWKKNLHKIWCTEPKLNPTRSASSVKITWQFGRTKIGTLWISLSFRLLWIHLKRYSLFCDVRPYLKLLVADMSCLILDSLSLWSSHNSHLWLPAAANMSQGPHPG